MSALPPDTAAFDATEPPPQSGDGGSPAVVIVVLADRVDELFDLTMASIAAQTYSNATLLVADISEHSESANGSEQGTSAQEISLAERVAAVTPDAYLYRLPASAGRAGAANRAVELVEGASFYFFVTAGTVLDPDTTGALVEELYRSNAGIVSPKMVDGDDPRRLKRVGMGADQFGVLVDLVEPGEFDQEQYDTVRDVFVAPAGAILIRSDLFAALEGFDPVMTRHGADLDLSWRAHVAGARVVVVPKAVVQAHQPESQDRHRNRDLQRHRLRTMLVASTKLHLARMLPLAVALLLIEALYCVLTGRGRQAKEAVDAIGWNLSQFTQIRQRRRKMAELRGISDREVRSLQSGGSARLSHFFRSQFFVGSRMVSMAGTVRESFSGSNAKAYRDGVGIAVVLAVLLGWGSRDFITGGVTEVGRFMTIDSAPVLWRSWLGDWVGTGVGGEGNPATALALLAVLKTVFFWAPGLVDTALVLIPLFAGPIGVWRLVLPLESVRASALAALAYAANPLMLSALSAAHWDSMVVIGAAPWLVGSALAIGQREPFTRPGRLSVRLLRFGLLTAFIASFVPAVVIAAVLICVGLFLGGMVSAQPKGGPSLIAGAAAAMVVPAAVHVPWSIDIARRWSWSWFVGPDSAERQFDSLADLIRFAPGGVAPSYWTLGIIAAAAVALLLAQGIRLGLATSAWTMAVVSWAVLWVDRRDWVAIDLPAPETMLAPAAVGIALAVGVAVRSVEVDLGGRWFGWRQPAALIGAVGLMISTAALARAAFDGGWGSPDQSYAATVRLMADHVEGPARVLWIGEPQLLGADIQRTEHGVPYVLTDTERSAALDRWIPGSYGLDAHVGEQLDLALDAETVRLGRLLAPYGIDYIAVVSTLAPSPYNGPVHEPPAGIANALLGQIDLQRVSGVADFTLFVNLASSGPAVGLDYDIADLNASAQEYLDTDLAVAERLNATIEPARWRWQRRPSTNGGAPTVSEPTSVLIATSANGWHSRTDGVDSGATAGGLLWLHPNGATSWTVERSTPWLRYGLLLIQAVIVAVGAGLLRSQGRSA